MRDWSFATSWDELTGKMCQLHQRHQRTDALNITAPVLFVTGSEEDDTGDFVSGFPPLAATVSQTLCSSFKVWIATPFLMTESYSSCIDWKGHDLAAWMARSKPLQAPAKSIVRLKKSLSPILSSPLPMTTFPSWIPTSIIPYSHSDGLG